jgi:RNA polymerase sigma-70 factor (family 1)
LNNNTSYQESPDLLLRFSQGQETAFAAVYEQFYDRVYGFAKRWIAEQSDVEDITADTFLKLWNRRETFESIDNIGAFLYITVRNGCFNFLRHTKIKSDRQDDIRRQIEESNEVDFANMEIRAEFLKLVYAEVDKMPSKMKAIFLLSYRDGLKPAEIAEKLELSVQTVKNQKANAVKLLRIALGHNPLLLAFLLYLEMQQGTGVWHS